MARNANHVWGAALLTLGLLSADSTRAADAPLAHVRFTGELLDEVVQSMLPATVVAPRGLADGREKPLRLLGVRYCGPGEKSSGRMRAVATLGPGQHRANVSCTGSLAEFAELASLNFPEGTLFLDLEAVWKSWELKLWAVRALVTAKDGPQPAPGFDKPFELATVSTADLRIDTGGRPLLLHAVPAFLEKTVEVAMALGDKAPARPPRPPSGSTPLAEQANCGAEIPVALAGEILRALTVPQPLSIPLQDDQVDIANVKLAAEGTGPAVRLTLRGTAEPRALRETMQWTLLTTGQPLRVSSVKVVPQYEDCASLGTLAAMRCNVRNGTRAATAEAFARGVTERYQTRLVHELASPLHLDFTVAGQRLSLQGDLLRMAFAANALSASARLEAR